MADRGFGDSKLLAHVAHHQRGTVVVEGKRTDVFQWSDGRRVTGQELLTRADWPWRDSLQLPRRRYVRLSHQPHLRAGHRGHRQGTQPGVLRPALSGDALTAPRLIRAWKRRSWIEHSCRTLTHLLATDACQVHGKMPTTGIWWRLLAGLVRLTARRLLKGRVTMEEIVFSLKHHWRVLHSKDLE